MLETFLLLPKKTLNSQGFIFACSETYTVLQFVLQNLEQVQNPIRSDKCLLYALYCEKILKNYVLHLLYKFFQNVYKTTRMIKSGLKSGLIQPWMSNLKYSLWPKITSDFVNGKETSLIWFFWKLCLVLISLGFKI